MSRFDLLLALFVLALSCITTSAAAEQLVVVPTSTILYRAPNSKSAQIKPSGKGFVTLKKLGSKKGWVHVEVNGTVGDHCAGSPWWLNELTLTMWVQRSKLSTVTSKILRQSHSDGTSLLLAAGVRVSEHRGNWHADMGGIQWPVNPAPSDIATSFEPAPLVKRKGTWMHATRDLVVGGEKVRKTAKRGFDVTNIVQSDGKTQYRVATRCLSAVVDGEFEEPKSGGGGLGMLGSLTGGTGADYWSVKTGTKVFWPDGQPAGLFRRQAFIYETKTKRGKLCATFGEPQVEVCFDPGEAKREKGQKMSDVFATGLGGLPADEGFSKNVIRRVIRQKKDELRRCYALAKRPKSVDDRVVFDFIIGPDGHVAPSSIKSSTFTKQGAQAEACMLGVIDTLIFVAKKGRKPAKVSYPFVFKGAQ